MQVAVRKIRSHDLFKILLLEKSGDFCTIYVVLFVMGWVAETPIVNYAINQYSTFEHTRSVGLYFMYL